MNFVQTFFFFITESSSNYIVTGPQCNFPYVSTGVARHSSTMSSSHTEIECVRIESATVQKVKSRKKKRSYFSSVKPKNSRTSIDNWIKRKKLLIPESTAGSEEISMSAMKLKECRILLSRIDGPLTGQHITAKASKEAKTTKLHSNKINNFEEDMTLKEIIEAQERLLASNDSFENSEQQLHRHVRSSKSSTTNDLISSKSVCKKSKKSSQLRTEFKASKSKSVIRSIEKKSTKRKELSTVTRTAAPKIGLEHTMGNCFVLLKRLKGIRLTTKGIDSSDTICRLPTKSPHKYQFKRSFEKITVIEKNQSQAVVFFINFFLALEL